MGLLGFFFDTWVLSTGIAAVRRWTGLSVKDILVPRIKSPNIQMFANGYFHVGEFSLNKGMEWITRTAARDGKNAIPEPVKDIEKLTAEIRAKQKQLDEALRESERRAGKL